MKLLEKLLSKKPLSFKIVKNKWWRALIQFLLMLLLMTWELEVGIERRLVGAECKKTKEYHIPGGNCEDRQCFYQCPERLWAVGIGIWALLPWLENLHLPVFRSLPSSSYYCYHFVIASAIAFYPARFPSFSD